MDIMLYITFIAVSAVLIVVPGPNVLVIVSTSVAYGTKRGLHAVFGTSSAMALQLLITAFGTAWFVESLAEGLEWLRWLGVGYLLYLGITHFREMLLSANEVKGEVSVSSTYGRGFVVSLTNPKTILFFGAFLPQFVSEESSYLGQVVVLSMTFLVLATILDACYAILAGKLYRYCHGHKLNKFQHGVSGVLFVGASAWLAFMRRG